MSGRERSTRRRRAELSQHFLADATAARLIQATSISDADLVVEIGPGRGALTRLLVRRAGNLIAVEVDPFLAKQLRRTFDEEATIVTADFLAFDFPSEPYCVVGSIPYARSTDIVRKLAAANNPPRDAWLVVQRELANRICGRPFGKETRWSLRLKPFWHLEIVDRLKKNEFHPPPSVDSVLLQMSYRGRPIVNDQQAWLDFVEMGFRGATTILQALRPRLSKLQLRRLARDLRFSVEASPGDLLFEQWLGLFRFVERLRVHPRNDRTKP